MKQKKKIEYNISAYDTNTSSVFLIPGIHHILARDLDDGLVSVALGCRWRSAFLVGIIGFHHPAKGIEERAHIVPGYNELLALRAQLFVLPLCVDVRFKELVIPLIEASYFLVVLFALGT